MCGKPHVGTRGSTCPPDVGTYSTTHLPDFATWLGALSHSHSSRRARCSKQKHKRRLKIALHIRRTSVDTDQLPRQMSAQTSPTCCCTLNVKSVPGSKGLAGRLETSTLIHSFWIRPLSSGKSRFTVLCVWGGGGGAGGGCRVAGPLTLVWGLPAGLPIFPTLVQIAEGNYSPSGLATATWPCQTAKYPRRVRCSPS